MREHLATLLDDFRRHGSQIAVVCHQGVRRRATSYAEIAHLAGRFAALLEARQVGPGDRVLLWAENSAEWIAAFYGCVLRGVLVVPLDAYGSADFAARVAADVRPCLAVGDEKLLLQLPAAEPEFRRLAFEVWLDSLPAAEAGPVTSLSGSTPLQILFTSGTTGDPKGVVLTHGNVLASVEPIVRGAQPYLRYEKIIHPLRILHTLPLSHVFGQTMGLWVPPILAAEVHFEDRLVAPRLVETIRRERISVLAAVPRVHALLKTHLETTYPGLADEIAAAHGIRAWKKWLRFRRIHSAFGLKFWALISGGGALSASLEEFWNGLGFVVVQGYGMTETTALITLNNPFGVTRGSIGKPLPGREVKLGADGEVLVRGPMISTQTWSNGSLATRPDEWLATGDLAEAQDTGDLRFLGRKSETIVTSAGVNLHPEDLEAALERQPGVAACAVVPIDTAHGPEPCAVLALRGTHTKAEAEQAAGIIEQANRELAEFQRLRRWVLWPAPDLPRTSTGKVRRRAVAEWLKAQQAAAAGQALPISAAASDWLLALIAQISGETPSGMGDELLLSEDLHLDSLGRVQLSAALEERTGLPAEDGSLDRVRTLGELRALLTEAPYLREAGASNGRPPALRRASERKHGIAPPDGGASRAFVPDAAPGSALEKQNTVHADSACVYPRWPWLAPVRWLRAAFLEAAVRPLVWLLAGPRVVGDAQRSGHEALLIVCNHVTAFDGPLVEYALPRSLRRKIAAAMSGEMLEDYRHFRNPSAAAQGRFMLFGPLVWLLLTALFNVFPLPRRRGFERSFAHAGQAMDRGFHVLVFPEGTRSLRGDLAPFRPGIGLLVRQTGAPVLPIAISGLGELKTRERGWFRSGWIKVHIGKPIRFSAADPDAAIAEKLHRAVAALLSGKVKPD